MTGTCPHCGGGPDTEIPTAVERWHHLTESCRVAVATAAELDADAVRAFCDGPHLRSTRPDEQLLLTALGHTDAATYTVAVAHDGTRTILDLSLTEGAPHDHRNA